MSLNNITLPPYLTAALYRNSLVDQAQVPASETISFLGKNKKQVLVIVHKPEVAFVEDAELLFLTSVLSACKLSLGDIAIVNTATLPTATDYLKLLLFFNSRQILLFDADPQSIDLPFNFPH